MKKFLLINIFVFSIGIMSCEADSSGCGTKTVSGEVKSLQKGPEGGCYYINSNGNKSYVDRTDCSC